MNETITKSGSDFVVSHHSIREMCRILGGQCATARLLGISDRSVRRWVRAETAPAPIVMLLTKLVEEVKE